MPLYENAEILIRQNLEMLARSEKPKFQAIGIFSEQQFAQINRYRQTQNLPPLACNEILYMGRHHYNSRVVKDGYTIDDLLQQIKNVIQDCSVVVMSNRMTAIENQQPRNDGYGNQVIDRAIFELTSKKPRAELFSVIPKNDWHKPKK
ncbi:MAG: hypothetical protein J6W29_10065 [Neisseriaceae bacterium]|nr:hypothetical protein [Neisseriaceae bacterium]